MFQTLGLFPGTSMKEYNYTFLMTSPTIDNIDIDFFLGSDSPDVFIAAVEFKVNGCTVGYPPLEVDKQGVDDTESRFPEEEGEDVPEDIGDETKALLASSGSGRLAMFWSLRMDVLLAFMSIIVPQLL